MTGSENLEWFDQPGIGHRSSGLGAEYQIVRDTKGDHEGWRVYAWTPEQSEPLYERFVARSLETAKAVAQGWEDDATTNH